MGALVVYPFNIHFLSTAGGALVLLTLIDLSIQHNRTQLQDCRSQFSSKTFSELDILEQGSKLRLIRSPMRLTFSP